MRTKLRTGSALLLLGPLAAGPALAATVETAESTERRPQPTEGSEVEVSFNPTASVTVGPGETIESLLLRLAAEINTVGAGSYVAHALTESYSLEIHRQDGSEIDQLRFSENDPGITTSRITVNMEGLEARVALTGETPSSGTVIVTLNDRVIPVTTTGLDAAGMAAAMLESIQDAGFAARIIGSEIQVTEDLRNATKLTRVGFRTTDPAIVTSGVALERSAAASHRLRRRTLPR